MDTLWLRLIAQRIQLLDEVKYKPGNPAYTFFQSLEIKHADLQDYIGRIYQLYPKRVAEVSIEVLQLIQQIRADDHALIEKIANDIRLLGIVVDSNGS